MTQCYVLNGSLQPAPEPIERGPPSKKRKVHHNDQELTNFTIYPCAAGTSQPSRAQTLSPIALIPRSRLPLSWIDTGPPGSLFTADIPALEDSLCLQNGSLVLAAGCPDHEHEHYLVERVKRYVYAISALKSNVREADLAVAAKGVELACTPYTCPSPPRLELAFIPDLDVFNEIPHSVSFAFSGVDLQHPGISDEACDGTPLSLPEEPVDQSLPGEESTALGITLPAEYFAEDQCLPVPQTTTADEMLSALKTQYLEALYVSKTSVAYFAKGPLSRARAAFQNTEDASSMRPLVLYHYYRSCILPMKKMDAKYRDALPKIISDVNLYPSDEGGSAPPAKKRRNNGKKTLGKNGLYASEEEFIANWWKSTCEHDSSVNKAERHVKRLIDDIRMRETQLQILLILEIIQLEGSVGELNEHDDGHTELPKKSKKRPKDMSTALELLLDRLCIWHAVSSSEFPAELRSIPDKTSEKQVNNDKLRDFCTEVIIPFYSARLPDQCHLINRKLGGPTILSPIRPSRSNTKRESNHTPKSTKTSLSKKRTLQRVKTDERLPTKPKAPSLLRNNTAPAAAGIQRESVDPISFSTSTAGGRGGIQKAKRVNNREVDLDAVAKQHQSKMKRMNVLVNQKRELDAAIHAIRKPNRELVSRSFVEAAEQRSSSATNHHPRKQKHPTRNPYGQGVQVMATPKGPRTKDCGLPNLPPLPATWKRPRPTTAAESIPDTSIQVVPSSSSRPRYPSPFTRPQPIFNSLKQRDRDLIQETPFKSVASGTKCGYPPNTFDSDTEPSFPQPDSSPTLFRKSNPKLSSTSSPRLRFDTTITANATTEISETPPRPKSMVHPGFSVIIPVGFTSPTTPVKCSVRPKATVMTPSQRRPNDYINRTTNETPEKSIYERLGWTNDDDDELAF